MTTATDGSTPAGLAAETTWVEPAPLLTCTDYRIQALLRAGAACAGARPMLPHAGV